MKEKSPNLTAEQFDDVAKELLPSVALKESLDQTKSGTPKSTVANFVKILKEDRNLAGSIRLNELTERIDIVKDLGWERNDTTLNDTDMAFLTLYIEENYDINCSRSLDQAIQIVSNENRYHPIRDLLNGLKWDGVPRVENILSHFLGVEKTELAVEALKLFMLGAVSRAFHPGCKFEISICIVGEQGAGKSTFLKFLALKDEFFSDDLKRLDDEKAVVKILGHWIIELPEMVAFSNTRTIEEIKSFISREKDTYRTPYDKHPRDRKRQCVFAGTSNKLEVLPMDKSGNRRIIPIEARMEKAEVHIMDSEEESRSYILQAWAEIMEIFRSGNFSLTLPDHLTKELKKYQQRFTPEDTDEEAIAEFLEETNEPLVCVTMLAYEALGYSTYERIRKNDCNRISEIMHHFPAWEPVGTRKVGKYGKARAWRRKNPPAHANDGFAPVPEHTEIPFEQLTNNSN